MQLFIYLSINFCILKGSASGLGSSSGHHPNKENIVGVDALGNMENLNNGNRSKIRKKSKVCNFPHEENVQYFEC